MNITKIKIMNDTIRVFVIECLTLLYVNTYVTSYVYKYRYAISTFCYYSIMKQSMLILPSYVNSNVMNDPLTLIFNHILNNIEPLVYCVMTKEIMTIKNRKPSMITHFVNQLLIFYLGLLIISSLLPFLLNFLYEKELLGSIAISFLPKEFYNLQSSLFFAKHIKLISDVFSAYYIFTFTNKKLSKMFLYKICTFFLYHVTSYNFSSNNWTAIPFILIFITGLEYFFFAKPKIMEDLTTTDVDERENDDDNDDAESSSSSD